MALASTQPLTEMITMSISYGLITACGFVWVWNLVVDIAGGKEAEGVWEHGVEENIWT